MALRIIFSGVRCPLHFLSGRSNASTKIHQAVFQCSPVPPATQPSRHCSAEPPTNAGLRLRGRQQLPFPEIKVNADFKGLLAETFKAVQHGGQTYKECTEGFVYVYVHASHDRFNTSEEARSSYVVVYGENHPMNHGGAVERRQELNHAKMYGILQAIKAIPENSLTKLCICVNETRVLSYVSKGMLHLSENSFRSVKTGRLIKDLETAMELNALLRSRTDLTIQLRYIPTNIHYDDAHYADQWAERLADELTRAHKQRDNLNLIDLDVNY